MKRALRTFLLIILFVGVWAPTAKGLDTIPSPIIEHLDSLKREGWKFFDIHEYVYNESMRLMGQSRFTDAELLFDTAAIFFISYDDFDNAARQLLSKSEIYNMSERVELARDIIQPIQSWKLSDSVRIRFLIKRGALLRMTDDPTLAEVDLLSALNLIRESNIHIFENVLYYELSQVTQLKGDFISSIEYTHKAIDAHTDEGPPYYMIQLLSQMAKLFTDIGNYDRALYYNSQGLNLADGEGMEFSRSQLHERRGGIFHRMGQQDSAKYYLRLSISDQANLKYKRSLIGPRTRMAMIFLEEEKLDSALNYLPNLKENSNPQIDGINTSISYQHVNAIYHRYIGELDKADDIITEVIYESQNKNRPLFFLSTLKTGALIAKDRNDLARYQRYVDQIQIIEDSLFNMRQSYQLHNIESEFQEKRKDIKLEKAAAENERRRKQIRFYLFVTLGLSALAALLFILFRNNRRKSRLLKKQNETITTVLNEKEVLLKEIHHRVKNNLQIVSSMLRMQSRNLNDPEAQSALKESEARIRSMALIHQDLYQEDDLSGIAMPHYLEKLISNIQKTYGQKGQVTIEQQIQDIRLDLDTVIPLGLIINELLTNAYKHAFDGGRGKINVSLNEKGGNLLLKIQDDGKGFDITSAKEGGFGLKMIKALSQKLGAGMTSDTSSGTTTLLQITKYKKVV